MELTARQPAHHGTSGVSARRGGLWSLGSLSCSVGKCAMRAIDETDEPDPIADRSAQSGMRTQLRPDCDAHRSPAHWHSGDRARRSVRARQTDDRGSCGDSCSCKAVELEEIKYSESIYTVKTLLLIKTLYKVHGTAWRCRAGGALPLAPGPGAGLAFQ